MDSLLDWRSNSSTTDCSTKMLVDAAIVGALMGKERDEAYELLEEMTSNDFQWQDEKMTPKKVAGMYRLDDITTLHAKLALLTKQVGEPSM